MAANSKNCVSLLAMALSAVAFAGCFGDGKVKVSGTVSVDGTPVNQGTIRFAPADGIGPTDGATISEGAYAVELTPGNKEVHIKGHKQVGEEKQNPDDPSSPILPVYEPIVSAVETANIAASQDDLNFDLPGTP